ncbi:MAG: glycosyltransferase family 4 protein [Candidatus Saccharimonadales bacterium]
MKKGKLSGKSLHVLYTGLVYKDVITGGDQLFLDIAPRLPKDLKIIIVAPQFTKKHWDKIDQPNFEYRFLKPNRFDNKGNPLLIFMSYVVRSFQVYKILKKDDVQTIYSSSDIAYADIWPAFIIAKAKGVKWLSRIYHVLLPPKTRQGSFLVNAVAFNLQRLSFWMMKKRSTTIFALNDKLYEEVLELGFPKEKLEILGAGIDYKKISSYKPRKKYPYDIVVLGRLTPVKGIFDAVKIWQKVHEEKPKARLAWIGGGSEAYQTKIKEQLDRKGLTKTFDLLGFIDKEEVYDILNSAKIFLCPDHENGWGLAVCEAMSCGLPVVSYDLDIFGAVYKKGFRSVKLYNTNAFAKQVIELLDKPALRKKIGQDAADQASQFDHQKVVKELVKYLN